MPTLLSSRKLTQSQAELILNAGFSFVEYNAIQFDFQECAIPHPVENAIITSQNTVRGILKNKIQIETCFCVGIKTKTLLQQNGVEVIAMREYGEELGELIARKYNRRKFTLFCGNRRRPEMPHIFQEKGIEYKEILIYKTHLNPQKFNRSFEGILFFSPSQIQCFVERNVLAEQCAFCIGTTTAKEARQYTDRVFISNSPTVESVIAKAVKVLGSFCK